MHALSYINDAHQDDHCTVYDTTKKLQQNPLNIALSVILFTARLRKQFVSAMWHFNGPPCCNFLCKQIVFLGLLYAATSKITTYAC